MIAIRRGGPRGTAVAARWLLALSGAATGCGRLGYRIAEERGGAPFDGSPGGTDGGLVAPDGAPATICPAALALFQSPSLVGRWQFDGAPGAPVTSATDSSGRGNHGSVVIDSNQSLVYTTGRFGSGARFDGTEDHIIVDGSGTRLDLGTAPLSVAGWVRTTADCSDDCSFVGNNLDVYGRDQVILSVGPDGGVHFHIADSDDHFNLWGAPGGGSAVDGQWHHLAGTWAYPRAIAYLDGVEVARQDYPTLAGVTNLASLHLGAYQETGCCDWQGFGGDLDELGLWATELTAADIQALAAQQPCP